MDERLPDPTDPAVIAIVDHFVSEGFDPGMADYDETAQEALLGLYAAGFTVTPWPSAPNAIEHAAQ